GGSGVISVVANIVPAEVRKLCDAMAAGDMHAAKAQHLRLYPLFKAAFVETNPIPIKAMLAMAGMIQNELRLPLVPLADEYRAPLAELLGTFGIDAKA
ncbi:hypothetical protein LCGC14_2065280, partial [marine sediment metagenome]